MADQAEEAGKDERAFGLTPSRVRGVIAILVLTIGLYAILFESEPPPAFEDVEISIPERPKPDFDERTIVLPDFEDSPEPEGVEPGEGVEISKAETEEAAVPEQVSAPAPSASEDTPAQAAEQTQAAEKEEPATQEAAPVAADQARQEEPVPAAEPKPDAKGRDAGGFFVQFAALKSEERAGQLGEQVALELGEPYYVQRFENNNGDVLYRVRLGPYGDDEAKARNSLSRLREQVPEISEGSFVDFE